MGFVILFDTAIILLLARPRIRTKTPAAFIEWSAFKELPFALFAIGIFFTLWGVYIAYFYVSFSGVVTR